MISKELLSEVLNIEHILEFRQSVNVFWVTDAKSHVGTVPINIYELAHKCKEWAVDQMPNKQALSSYPRWGNYRDYPDTKGEYYVCKHLVTGVQFEADTEPEAIFKACQWILDNKNKQ